MTQPRLLLVLAMVFYGLNHTQADDHPSFLTACMRIQPKRWDKEHNLLCCLHL